MPSFSENSHIVHKGVMTRNPATLGGLTVLSQGV